MVVQVLSKKCKVKMAYSEAQLKSHALDMSSLLRTDTASASCSSRNDEEMVRTKVDLLGGFAYVDECIFDFRLQALQSLMRKFPDLKAMID